MMNRAFFANGKLIATMGKLADNSGCGSLIKWVIVGGDAITIKLAADSLLTVHLSMDDMIICMKYKIRTWGPGIFNIIPAESVRS